VLWSGKKDLPFFWARKFSRGEAQRAEGGTPIASLGADAASLVIGTARQGISPP
jgi:hypothetical protein